MCETITFSVRMWNHGETRRVRVCYTRLRRKCGVSATLNSDRDRRGVFIRVIRMIRGRGGREGEVREIHREYSTAWPVSCCHKALGLACNPLLRTDNTRARASVCTPGAVICMCARCTHGAIIAVSHGTLEEVRGL